MADTVIQIAPPIPTITEEAQAELWDNYVRGIGRLAPIRDLPSGTRAEIHAKAVALSDLTVASLRNAGRACARGPLHAAEFPALAAPGAGATPHDWQRHQGKMGRAAFVAQRHPRASLQATGGAVSAAEGEVYDGALPLPCALLQSSFNRRRKGMV